MDSLDRLRPLIGRILDAPSPFYRTRLLDAGIRNAESIDAAAWSRLPLTQRHELVHDQLTHAPRGTRSCADAAPPVRAGTTGSNTELLVLLWTAADLARERAAGARLFRQFGIQPGQRIANTLPGALATPGALLLGDVMEEIGALDVPLGIIENETAGKAAWELIDRVQPMLMILEPASAVRLLAAAPVATRPWWHGIVWLRTDNDVPVSVTIPPALGFTGWQRTWLAVAEATSFVAQTCALGSHHLDDAVLVEIVDPDSAVLMPSGSWGTLVLTPYGFDEPVLRYATSMRARFAPDPCACGVGRIVEVA